MDVSLTRVGSLPQFTDYNIRRRKLDIAINILQLGTMSDTLPEILAAFAEASRAMPFIGGCKDGETRPVRNFQPEVEHNGFRFFYDVVRAEKSDGEVKFIAIPACDQKEL